MAGAATAAGLCVTSLGGSLADRSPDETNAAFGARGLFGCQCVFARGMDVSGTISDVSTLVTGSPVPRLPPPVTGQEQRREGSAAAELPLCVSTVDYGESLWFHLFHIHEPNGSRCIIHEQIRR